ncbi:MAG: urease accessory protein UreF [Verrucomicrobia bacterium]|nr:urease accessory protein UreF [Verrucomicrobiota bacterium]
MVTPTIEPLSSSPPLGWLLLVLQTSDPLFPTGAYAHSLGLEELVRLGVVRDAATLGEFLQTQIVPALAHQELPYLRFALDAATRGDLDELCAIDHEINAWKIARELREASASLGVRRLKMLTQIAPTPLLQNFADRVAAGTAHGHHLTVCGLQFAAAPLDAALATYLYQTLAAFCSAALKLIRIGQEACQRVLRECLARDAANTIAQSQRIARADAGWFNPLLEIPAMRHERANERLFIS